MSASRAVHDAILQSPLWHRATTLAERVASLQSQPSEPGSDGVDHDRASRRLERWRSEPPFDDDTCFAQRLAQDGLTEVDLRRLLGEPIEAVRDRPDHPLDWLVDLARAYSHSPAPGVATAAPPSPGDGPDAFLIAVEPIVRQAVKRLEHDIRGIVESHSPVPFDPIDVRELLLPMLHHHLRIMLPRAMVLELSIARLQGQLHGATPEERFQSFLQHLAEPDVALSIFERYPVLARQIMACVDMWVTTSCEFLHRLTQDWPAICAAFAPNRDPGEMIAVEGDRGDRHCGGRSVVLIEFSSGFRLVYKPRPLAVDRCFQKLLTWLNQRSDTLAFRTLEMLDRGTYGWEELVAHRACASVDEVERFYERQGAYLALLYALEATDFHSENLIAEGEHPVLLDLEALFHPREPGAESDEANEPATSAIVNSVLRVGLLPYVGRDSSDSRGFDVSGLGAEPGQVTPYRAPYWQGSDSDEMHLGRRHVTTSLEPNRPTLGDEAVEPSGYTEAVVSGFSGMYRLLLQHREDLLSADGPLTLFADAPVRVIFRQTATYEVLLRESFHPDLLSDALDRDRHFDRLWRAVDRCPWLTKVIPAERQDLLRADIPLFTTRPNTRDVWTSTNELIPELLDQPGMALVRHRIEHLSQQDLDRQVWIIRAAMATIQSRADRSRTLPYRAVQSGALDRAQLLAAARKVGDRLETLALGGDHGVSWIGLVPRGERYWSVAPLGLDLYDGLPGVILFLAYLGEVSGERRYTTLARAGLATLRRELERERGTLTSVGAFDGWGGIIYALTHLSILWSNPALLNEADGLVDLLPGLIASDEELDLISGAAGCIGTLRSLHQCAASKRTLATMVQCGDRLLAGAQTMADGIGWVTPWNTRALAGFSHGAAGISWSLLELAALSGEERFRVAARKAITYERSLFSATTGNWRDLRDPENPDKGASEGTQDKFMVAWCHGAPGIGLARLHALRHLDDPAAQGEVEVAVRTTIAEGFGGNHCLCHGDLGNLELLLQASEVLDRPPRREVDRLAGGIVQSIDQVGGLCGNPSRIESPGLMTGLAGIGYGLLRLAEPERVPAVLTLAPPPR
jgi:type 2 lantibiotic biosynthesis protein LanM